MAVLVLTALVVMAYGAGPHRVQQLGAIQPGSGYLYAVWGVFLTGNAEGSYRTTDGTEVQVLVLDASDYLDFSNELPYSALYEAVGAAENFSVSVSGVGNFYVVFTHPPGSNGAAQDLMVSMTTSGLDPTFAIAALAMLGVAAGLGFVAFRRFRQLPPGVHLLRTPPSLPPSPVAEDVPVPVPGAGGPPVAALRVTLVNSSASARNVRIRVNGLEHSPVLVPAGASKVAGLYLTLPSKFGATATIEAVTDEGPSASASAFLRAWDRAVVEITLK